MKEAGMQMAEDQVVVIMIHLFVLDVSLTS